MITSGASLLVEFTHCLREERESLRIIEGARHEPESLRQPTPDILPKRGPGVSLTESCTIAAKS